ncbi:hypothetical protein JB92DRAFT_1563925 [Gautieria morchelliformis]|nr:hypothetical protein JB92DRAFT_1563925 [Gautieria morchelliformis]
MCMCSRLPTDVSQSVYLVLAIVLESCCTCDTTAQLCALVYDPAHVVDRRLTCTQGCAPQSFTLWLQHSPQAPSTPKD